MVQNWEGKAEVANQNIAKYKLNAIKKKTKFRM